MTTMTTLHNNDDGGDDGDGDSPLSNDDYFNVHLV